MIQNEKLFDEMIEAAYKEPVFKRESIESFQDGDSGDSVEELMALIQEYGIE